MTNIVWFNQFHRELCSLALGVIAAEQEPILITSIVALLKRQGASQATAEMLIGTLIACYKIPVIHDGAYLKFKNGGA